MRGVRLDSEGDLMYAYLTLPVFIEIITDPAMMDAGKIIFRIKPVFRGKDHIPDFTIKIEPKGIKGEIPDFFILLIIPVLVIVLYPQCAADINLLQLIIHF